MFKIMLLVLLPVLTMSQDTLSVGKPLRQSGQYLAIATSFATAGIASILIGDKIKNEAIENFGDVLTVCSFPFIIIGINKLYIAGQRQEYLENKYIYGKK